MCLLGCLVWIWSWEVPQKPPKAPSTWWFCRRCRKSCRKCASMSIQACCELNQNNQCPYFFFFSLKWHFYKTGYWIATQIWRLLPGMKVYRRFVNGDMQHDSPAVLSRMRPLWADSSRLRLSNKQIKPQIHCVCTLTGAIHFQSDIQAARTGNHNELFTLRSLHAVITSPRHLFLLLR